MTDTADDKRATADSFGVAADAYLDSDVHRQGDDLDRLASWCADASVALDVATGAGHTAGAVAAAGASRTVATDASPEMVATAVSEFDGVEGVVADAERLPFSADAFDAAACRIAAHHFPDPQAFVEEVARVLEPGGTFALEDNVAPEDDELGEFINRVEALRDPTHVESYATSQWHEWLSAAGFEIEETLHLKKTLTFDPWTAAQSLTADEKTRVEDVLLDASDEATEFYEIEVEDGEVVSFANLKALVRATKTT
jgi:ubiquinone/menaquinone biosynthesis C-methylase UbiE